MVVIKDILDAVEELMQERFPGRKAYRNLVRKNFDRPSFLLQAVKQTMADATARTVERTCEVRVTLFAVVDDYHDSQIDTLAAELTSAMELFSCRAIAVKDRYLDVGDAVGTVAYDYAELTVPLSWQDDRDLTEPAYEPAEHYEVTVLVNEKER